MVMIHPRLENAGSKMLHPRGLMLLVSVLIWSVPVSVRTRRPGWHVFRAVATSSYVAT